MAAVGYMQDLADRLYGVLTQVRALGHEDNPKGAIAEFLRSFPDVRETDVEVEGGYTDKDGSFRETDIMARGVAFEVKKDVRDLGTDKPNDAGTQINRRLNIFRAEGVGWATNGERWIRYVWQEGGKGEIKESKVFNIQQREGNLVTSDVRNLINTLDGDLKPRPAPTGKAVIDIFTPVQRQVAMFSKKARKYKSYQIKFDLWQDQLRGAHMKKHEGEEGHELFVNHTFLTAAARLIAAELSQGASTDIVARITAGGGFSTWLNWEGEEQNLREEGKKICSAIYQAVIHYDWGKAGEDILKHLYQDFIPKKDRHDFGEYYTPDWLAEMVTEKVLDEDYCKQALKAAFADEDLAGLGVLDPGCGSGTFLRAAAKRLLFFAKDMGKSDLEISNAIISLVYGFDIHPVAVELARATLLESLPEKPNRPVQIYLGDALQLHRESFSKNLGAIALFEQGGMLLQASDENGTVMFPKSILVRKDFEEIVDKIAGDKANSKQIKNLFLGYQIKEEEDKKALSEAAQIFQKLRDEGKNGIWAWFIRNLAQPHRLATSRVARIIGNPPWITHHDWEGARQDDLKKMATLLNLWHGGKLAPHNDLAALFVVRVLKLYWASSAQISERGFGFVLPGSALKSGAWERFRNINWGGADLSESPPLRIETKPRPFSHSTCCVVFGKSGKTRALASPQRLYGDTINYKIEGIKKYPNENSDFHFGKIEKLVRQGATLVPNVLVRVNKKDIKKAGPKTVQVTTCKARHKPWSSFKLKTAEIETDSLYPAIWSDSLLPFRTLDIARFIMPLKLQQKKGSEARRCLADYWIDADLLWKKYRQPLSPESLLERCDLGSGLSSQLAFLGNSLGNRVIYNKSGSNMSAAVISEKNQAIIDCQLYRIKTRSLKEAYYLTAILNSDALSSALRASQKSDRDFHTHPFQKIPIKRYNDDNEHHQTLATLGKKAEQEAAAESINEQQTTKSRKQIRNALRSSKTMQHIDTAVKAILPDYCD